MNAIAPTPSRLAALIEALTSRAAEAALGRTRIVNAPLRETLRERLMQKAGTPGSLLADPVLEAAFGHETVPETMAGLAAAGLLHPDTVAALSQSVPLDRSHRNDRNTMPLDRNPYTHQLDAWRSLAADPARCALVSSGTGSGKTEAFLVPILDSLVREMQQGVQGLTGVRALMIYPLNALIASQRDRLSDWTAPFGSSLRFGLYNGQMPEEAKAPDAQRTPWEVRDRRSLRANPPPILVTNATMLEYMLVRPIDAPLLARSQGRLRFIVLDEAHTYLGSQAAEMTLLLRRTLRALGVPPQQVRFVATSATLGGDADVARTEKELRLFLAALAGADEGRVDVILGRRFVPPLEPGSYRGLADDRGAVALRASLANAATTLADLSAMHPGVDVAAALERGMHAEEAGRGRFLPLRLHLFQRAQAGLFACIDPACSGRAASPLDSSNWPFGAISERDRARCSSCDSVMFEVLTCDDCGAPALDAEMSPDGRRLVRPSRVQAVDEFAPDNDALDLEDDKDAPPGEGILLMAPEIKGGTSTHIAKHDGILPDRAEETVRLGRHDSHQCPCCGAGGANRTLFRPVRLGGAFFLGTAGNVLLDAAPARDGRMPHDGRQMITFTDNRQGTARFAASWQQDSERNFVRARVWHTLQEQSAQAAPEGDKLGQIERGIADPNTPGFVRAMLEAQAEELRRQMQTHSEGRPRNWTDLENDLAVLLADEKELLLSWKDLEPHYQQPDQLARLSLLAEFVRRPNRANSLETMGLASLRFPALENLGPAHLPALFRARGATIEDWRDYLSLVLTYFVRARSAVAITDRESCWIGQRIRPKVIMPPGEPTEGAREIAWPILQGLAGRTSRPALILRDGLGLDLEDQAVRAEVNEVLRRAWDVLRPLGKPGLKNNGFQLDLTKATVAPVAQVWRCPVTHRLLDRTFCGLSPFSNQKPALPDALRAERLAMPRLPAWPIDGNQRAAVENWLRVDVNVATLRRAGLWTDIADRLALLSPYVRIVEHSAQQPGWRLRQYEDAFKRGAVNVLNCSTTMEMGVDIGGITTVAMANVPPSPASYRQRVGRAGRRGEGLSVAYTYCPDTPVGWHAFDRPGDPLRRRIAPPRVTLDSRVLAQRHANAMLLADFLRQRGANLLKMEVGLFFLGDGTGNAPCERFLQWLRTEASVDPALQRDLQSLLRGTGLAASKDVTTCAADRMELLLDDWYAQRAELQQDYDAATGAARTALGYQIKRLDGEYLPAELTRLAWLPGHGFPTGVVPFVVPREPGTDEGSYEQRSHPTRTLDIAMREYAPGADVVLNGAVHRSGGVTLNWKRPASDDDVQEVQALCWFWQCRRCGASGQAVRSPELCAACGNDAGLVRTRALIPAGFAADPHRPTTNAMDYVERVPPPEPLVSCAGAPWVAFGAGLGRYRNAPDGSVMTVSRGPAGYGYAICLACGRAEPESAVKTPLPQAMVGHLTLRARQTRRCDGSTDQRVFAVQRNLALGHSRRTEVFELQLEDVLTEAVAYTIAVALREALCRQLGIERDEVACSVAKVPGAGGQTWSLLLSDTAAGGAGYAGTTGMDLQGHLQRARSALDCLNPGCERACPACLILRDTAAHAEHLDRYAAAEFLDELLPRIALPPSARVLQAEDERLASAPIPAELLRAVEGTPGSILTMLLHGPASNWELPVWWGAPVIERLARTGYSVRLLAAREALEKASVGELSALRTLQDRAGGELVVAAWTKRPLPSTLLGTVERPGDPSAVMGWAALTESGCCVGAVPPPEVVRGKLENVPQMGAPLDLRARAEELRATAHRVSIGTELDVPVTAFGTRLIELLRGRPGIRAALAACGSISAIEYDDRYLRAPVALRLLVSVLRALSLPAGVPIRVRTADKGPEARDGLPSTLRDDWREPSIRDAVLGHMLRSIGSVPDVLTVHRSAMPHARSLSLIGSKGRATIILDQGLGFWRPTTTMPFAFTVSAQAQAKALLELKFNVRGEPQRTTEVFVEAKQQGVSPL